MKLFIKGKMFASPDTMTVTGEDGEELYYLKRDKSKDVHKNKSKDAHTVTLSDSKGVKIATIEQRGIGGKATITVIINGVEMAVVERKRTMKPRYVVNGPGWDVTGSLLSNKYKVTKGNKEIAELVATTLKSEINIADTEDPIFAVAVIMAIRLKLYYISMASSSVYAASV